MCVCAHVRESLRRDRLVGSRRQSDSRAAAPAFSHTHTNILCSCSITPLLLHDCMTALLHYCFYCQSSSLSTLAASQSWTAAHTHEAAAGYGGVVGTITPRGWQVTTSGACWMHACLCACMHCMYARMYARMYVSMYVCMYACMYVCVFVCVHLWTFMYACMYACACMCILWMDVCVLPWGT